eukprot:6214230-Pleurochrysis_carterae.AAC.8
MNHMRSGWRYSSVFSLLPKRGAPAMCMAPACLSTVATKITPCQPLLKPQMSAAVHMRARGYHDGAAIEAATARTHRLLAAKAASGKTFDQIADERVIHPKTERIGTVGQHVHVTSNPFTFEALPHV